MLEEGTKVLLPEFKKINNLHYLQKVHQIRNLFNFNQDIYYKMLWWLFERELTDSTEQHGTIRITPIKNFCSWKVRQTKSRQKINKLHLDRTNTQNEEKVCHQKKRTSGFLYAERCSNRRQNDSTSVKITKDPASRVAHLGAEQPNRVISSV